MGVYVKGMEMPESCWECPCMKYDEPLDERCGVTGKKLFLVPQLKSKLKDCPLIETEIEDE